MTSDPIPKIISQEKYERLRRQVLPAIPYQEKRLLTYYQTLLDLGRWAGLRCSEAIKLKLNDIDFLNGLIYIRDQKNGWKNYAHPIPEEMLQQLRIHVRKYRKDFQHNCKCLRELQQKERKEKEILQESLEGKSQIEIAEHLLLEAQEEEKFIEAEPYLFFSHVRNNSTGHLSKAAVRGFFHRLRENTGYTQTYDEAEDGRKLYILSFHTLRHLYGTWVFEKCKDIRITQMMLRHKSYLSTLRYENTSVKMRQRMAKEVYESSREGDRIAALEGKMDKILLALNEVLAET